ncbi:MAG TPA: hypothetical protein ENJ33_01380 [Thiothrix sp.]|nr:hypothetical protein [Thiothrix sp.]
MLTKKLTASLYHFLISLLIVGAFLAFVKFYWYPGHLLAISGVTSILLILVAIDITLGPLMTFVVYKPNKPKLKLDLSIIAALQIAAFSYGMFTIYQGHPLYVVYAVNSFTVATANEIDPNDVSNKQLLKSKLAGPQIAFAKMPKDPKESADILFGAFAGKPDIDKLPQYFEPYDKHLDDIFAKSIDLTKLLDKKDTKQELEKFFSHNGDKGDFAYLPLVGKSKDVIWAFNKKTGKPAGIINIDPYQMAVNN